MASLPSFAVCKGHACRRLSEMAECGDQKTPLAWPRTGDVRRPDYAVICRCQDALLYYSLVALCSVKKHIAVWHALSYHTHP